MRRAANRTHLDRHRRLARTARKVWLELGALEYCECVGVDLDVKWAVPLPRRIRLKRGERVVFSWMTYQSRAQRDRIVAKVMKARGWPR